MKKLATGNRTVTSQLVFLKLYSCWMTVTSTNTALSWVWNGNYLKTSEIFALRSTICIYLRHATSPAGINFLDLLNLIPIIIVKRKEETVKDNPIYLCSHFSQWTSQEHRKLSKVIAVFLRTAIQWNIRSEIESVKTFLLFQSTPLWFLLATNKVSMCSRILILWRPGKFSVSQFYSYLNSWVYQQNRKNLGHSSYMYTELQE